MTTTRTVKISLRCGTSAEWVAANPVLLKGEVGVEHEGGSTTPRFKVGDGTLAWVDLAYNGGSGGGGEVTAASVTAALAEAVNNDTLGPQVGDAVSAAIAQLTTSSRQAHLAAEYADIVSPGETPFRNEDGDFEGLTVGIDVAATPAQFISGEDGISDGEGAFTPYVLGVAAATFWNKRANVEQINPYVINLDGTAESLNVAIPVTMNGDIQFGSIGIGLEGYRGRITLKYGGPGITTYTVGFANNASGASVINKDGLTPLSLTPYRRALVMIEYEIITVGATGGLVMIRNYDRYTPPFEIVAYNHQNGAYASLPAHLRTDSFLIMRARSFNASDTLTSPWSHAVTPYVDADAGPFSFQLGKAVAPADNSLTYPFTNASSRHAYVHMRGGRVIQAAITSAATGTALTLPTLSGINPNNRLIGGVACRADQTSLDALMPSGWTQLINFSGGSPNLMVFATPGAHGSASFAGGSGTFDTETGGWAAWIAEVGQ